MSELPVHWHEGMFLRPQHFQAAERYWAHAQNTSQQWDHAYHYGVRSIEYSKQAIANHEFELTTCQARMRDGTIISIAQGQSLDRIDLKEAFERNERVTILLAVPKLQLGRANVGHGGTNGALHRYTELRQEIQDESSGGADKEIELRALNVRLMLSTEDPAGYETLPLAVVERSGDSEAVPQVFTEYVPPLLSIDCWPELGRDIIRAAYDIIGKKIEVLAAQVLSRGITLESREPGDLDRIMLLSVLNPAHCRLRVTAFASGIHPLVAYTELSSIVGDLSIFKAETRRPPEIPLYDHDDLGRIFKYLKLQIEELIDQVGEFAYEQRYFIGRGLGLEVNIDPKWLNSDWEWHLGINKGDLTEHECREIVSPGVLDWKLGSSAQVDAIFKFHMEGVALNPSDRPPRALPASAEWVYYSVSRGNAAWNDVQKTQSLAMRLMDKLIVNKDKLQGQRRMIVNVRGREMPLEFCLFAVPKMS